jgi:hypothetical protein
MAVDLRSYHPRVKAQVGGSCQTFSTVYPSEAARAAEGNPPRTLTIGPNNRYIIP